MSANENQIGGTHYKDMAVQPWDAMRAWMSTAQFAGFLLGNVIKYAARHHEKGGVEDLRKARHYLDKLIEVHEETRAECASVLRAAVDAMDGVPAGQAVPHKFGPGDPGWITHVRLGESLDDAAKRATDASRPAQFVRVGETMAEAHRRWEDEDAARAPEWPGPDWSQAPEWAMWWAVDGDDGQHGGGVFAGWYEGHEPPTRLRDPYWTGEHRKTYTSDFGYTGDWRDSLRKRPETPKCDHVMTVTKMGRLCRECGMSSYEIRQQQQGK